MRCLPTERGEIVLAISGPFARADIPALCDEVRAFLEGYDGEVVVCDVEGLAPDVVTVDAMARFQLIAGRQRCRIRLRHACEDLQALISLMGLREVVSAESR